MYVFATVSTYRFKISKDVRTVSRQIHKVAGEQLINTSRKTLNLIDKDEYQTFK